MTQVLLRAINMSGKLHMVPAVINDDYVIRFAVCSVRAGDDDISYAWNVIAETTAKLASQSASFDLNRPAEEHVRQRLCCCAAVEYKMNIGHNPARLTRRWIQPNPD